MEDDQHYRTFLHYETMDEQIIAELDSVFNEVGIEAGFAYEQSLELSLPAVLKDSLWELQAQLDWQNHLILRGIIDVYGFVPKSIVTENNSVQQVLLFHPPKDWEPEAFLDHYSKLLLPEVQANRMPAKSYALFYDNILCKILKKTQLYGTNQRFDPSSRTILPPEIADLRASNEARVSIGLEPLKDGEYTVLKP